MQFTIMVEWMVDQHKTHIWVKQTGKFGFVDTVYRRQ